MLESVVECLVQCKLTTKEYIYRGIMIGIDILIGVVLLITMYYLVPSIGLVLVAFAVPVTYLVFRNTTLEYEYSYFDGEMTIDKVMKKRARKRLHTFSFNKLEVMAPEGSSYIRTGNNSRKKFDYSSHDKEQRAFIAVLYDEKNAVVELKFEPNDELLERLQYKHPRKIYLD